MRGHKIGFYGEKKRKKNIPELSSGPGCSKHHKLNELVNRSTREVFHNFISKYTEIFC